jgi:hypothetical protein
VTAVEKRIHALLIHENFHSERQSRWGRWYRIRYHLSRSFRLNEEKLAYEAQIVQLVNYRLPVLFTWFAQMLSGPVYRHMISFDEALRWVKSVVAREADLEFMFESLGEDELVRRKRQRASADNTIALDAPPDRIAKLKDRIALVATALLMFAIVQAIEFAIVFATGAYGAK